MTLIAQISDLHVQAPGQLAYGVVDTNPLVVAAIAHLNQLSVLPDVIVASGDLVHRGTPAEYDQLKTILAPLQIPLYLMPGNHDQRDALRQAFPDHTYLSQDQQHLSYTIENYSVRLIMLDTIIPGKGSGSVDAERLSWLAHQLAAAPDTATIIFMHHPSFPTGMPWMDRRPVQGQAALAALIQQHPQIERISCGHLHRTIRRAWCWCGKARSDGRNVHASRLAAAAAGQMCV
ncbi:MAG: phosphodiesterase [Moorea sp. SIO3C2]|nr:phosphodiesterase [Moorena sp. SIO3C2]